MTVREDHRPTWAPSLPLPPSHGYSLAHLLRVTTHSIDYTRQIGRSRLQRSRAEVEPLWPTVKVKGTAAHAKCYAMQPSQTFSNNQGTKPLKHCDKYESCTVKKLNFAMYNKKLSYTVFGNCQLFCTVFVMKHNCLKLHGVHTSLVFAPFNFLLFAVQL